MREGPDYEIVDVEPGVGRTRWLIRCLGCNREKWVFVWSFAGNGKTRCLGCHKWMEYQKQ
jgi:hypothetical protein